MANTKVDVSSPQAFYNATIGKAFDMDGVYGPQCTDLFKLFTNSMYGKMLPTGTGGASGYWTSQKSKVLALGMTAITDKNQLQNGDWVIFAGQPGHVAMYYNGKFLGQNQKAGATNGWPTNCISISLNGFLGAFRANAWAELAKKQTEAAKKTEAKSEAKSTSTAKKVVLPTGITLAALAAACGLTVPQLLSSDTTGTLSGVGETTVLTDDQAKAASNAAEGAVEKETGKTPEQLAQERCGDNCVAVTVEKWNGGKNNGTIWTACGNVTGWVSNAKTKACVDKTIADNAETIAITAAQHNLPADGNWIFPNQTLWIAP